ncbi:hypothetical protein M378DRAFT_168049 [Amanita muscaria Koide BX008]|uniref:Uncharacterized protein n=1 Tax=Amanita muscaria (strain Koide BX008) TaxID=946122 RepID=A0A0C2SC47_AMAMK|nr:hypothetical protein M378DRAFT_168049 [Amanita muscaria Koide BX008]
MDRNYFLPVFWIYEEDKVKFVDGNVNEQNESVDKWLERSSPNFVTRIRLVSCNNHLKLLFTHFL